MRSPVGSLTRRPEFLRVAASGQKYVTPSLVLQVCRQRAPGNGLRVGFTASRRVGNAVARNRARRRLRAAVRAVMPVHAKADFDYVVIARAATLRRPFAALTTDLEKALKRLDLWCGP